MSAIKICPDCGIELPPDSPAGVCPKCLLQAAINDPEVESGDDATLITDSVALADAPTIPPTEHERVASRTAPEIGTKLKYFGDYELLDEIARGGMGVVYKARQVNLNRVVALKMILKGQLASEEDVQRFYTEAEAAAKLEHPGIVPIFEIGEHTGQHFFSMGFIDGESLAVQVKEGPLPPRDAASLTRQIAEAIAFAHENNVIHRDLKPANVLIDRNGQAKVTDFGLAKHTDASAELTGAELTGTGQILGTPGYMPPEQAAGDTDRIGPAADIYSLGAVLYALLTGRAPFQSASVMDTLMQVLEKEPVAPRELNSAVDQDLETICLKCLQKEPGQRYQTASELSEDLQRYLNGEAVLARPIGQAARLWRWCKRNRTVAALTVTVAASLIVGIVVSGYFAIESDNRATDLQKSEKELRVERNSALRLAAEKDWLAQEKNELAVNESEARKESEEQRELAEQRLAQAERLVYASQIVRAQREWKGGVYGSARATLTACRLDFRGWEYNFLVKQFKDGQRTLSGHTSLDGPFRIDSVVISPDGKWIVIGGGHYTDFGESGDVSVFDFQTGQKSLELKGYGRLVAISPIGKRVVSASLSGQFKVWNTASGDGIIEYRKKKRNLRCLGNESRWQARSLRLL